MGTRRGEVRDLGYLWERSLRLFSYKIKAIAVLASISIGFCDVGAISIGTPMLAPIAIAIFSRYSPHRLIRPPLACKTAQLDKMTSSTAPMLDYNDRYVAGEDELSIDSQSGSVERCISNTMW